MYASWVTNILWKSYLCRSGEIDTRRNRQILFIMELLDDSQIRDIMPVYVRWCACRCVHSADGVEPISKTPREYYITEGVKGNKENVLLKHTFRKRFTYRNYIVNRIEKLVEN